MVRRPVRLLPILLALCLVAAACGDRHDAEPELSAQRVSDERPADADGGSRPGGLPDGWSPAALRWVGCADHRQLQCASLEVPLDWDAPDGPGITLALARTVASGDRIGPLLSNPGGPGASGIDFLSWEPFGPPVTERFDVVSWDPRGVGRSRGLTCGDDVTSLLEADPDPDDAAEQAELESAAHALSTECERTDGDVLGHLDTVSAARDLEAIRRALGGEQLNYVGFSYGTHIGQVYAEMFGPNIRSMVLDAVVDPAQGYEEMLLGQARAFDRAFARGITACSAAGVATCGVEDLAAAYDDVQRRVEAAPLGPSDSPTGPSVLATAALLTSYETEGWRTLGSALADALDGDGTALRQLAESYWDFGGFASYVAVVCTDSPPPAGVEAYRAFAERARAVSARFGGTIANELLSCATWPVAAVGEPSGISAPAAPPILVVGNTGDAATPYENAVAVADRLHSGVLVTADIDGHAAYHSSVCVAEVVDDYLVRLAVPAADPRCT